jgi:hypothetical protein
MDMFRNRRFLLRTVVLIPLIASLLAGCRPAVPSAAITPQLTPPSIAASNAIDASWGPYLAEREWGNPRNATSKNNGWSFTYDKAITTPYTASEDGIAALTNQTADVAFAYAFFQPGQKMLTERFFGVDNPSGEYGENIVEDRVFYETTPNYSYMRFGYNYPYQAQQAHIEMEYAKLNSQTFVAQVSATGLEKSGSQPLHLVPITWFHEGGSVTRMDEHTWDAATPTGHFVVIASRAPDSWQITENAYPKRAAFNAAMIKNNQLANSGEGNKAGWDFVLPLAPDQIESVRFGLAFAADSASAKVAAQAALDAADTLLSQRKAEAQALYKNDVSAHGEVYQAALMSLLFNKMLYRYDGSYQIEWKGKVKMNDIVFVPDKWEFPWVAMWDSAFQANVATLVDLPQAKHDLALFLSDRWETEGGHVPNTEWDLLAETPPLFAWAAWQIYQKDGDKTFLEQIYPGLDNQSNYLHKAFDRDKDGLFTGGFMGMDNIPRPGRPDDEEADLSGWMAFFFRDMVKISNELGKTDRAQYYQEEYQKTADAINAQLWDEETGFYYDRNSSGFLKEKSYSGLIPFIAGVAPADREQRIIAALSDPKQFWTPYGIRSLSAQSSLYEPGYSISGWKNSNWRGPVWMPINYLLVQRLQEVNPDLADQLREALITNVESQWQQTGRFYEYYDAETGSGYGADHQTGWTALVANLIAEKYAK